MIVKRRNGGGHLNDEASRARRKRYYREVMYPANRKKYLTGVKARTRSRRAAMQAEINILKSKPCTDCGNTFPPICMDFDHTEGHVKLDNVATLIQNHSSSMALILAEIAKCELVCSNCHRIRTAQRTALRGQNKRAERECLQMSLLEAV